MDREMWIGVPQDLARSFANECQDDLAIFKSMGYWNGFLTPISTIAMKLFCL